MENVNSMIGNPWTALILMIIGGALSLILRSFITKYTETRAQHIAEGVDFPEKLARTFVDQITKSSATRLDLSKAEAAMKIIGIMSQIESILLNWELTAFFNSDELQENQTIEDLGIRDLKKASQLLMDLLNEANKGSVILGEALIPFVIKWATDVRILLFSYQAVYITSKESNKEKAPVDNDRVITISNISKSEIYPKMVPLNKIKAEIRNYLKNVANVS